MNIPQGPSAGGREANEPSVSWGGVIIVFGALSPEARSTHKEALNHNAEATGRLVQFLAHLEKTRLFDLELLIEKPARATEEAIVVELLRSREGVAERRYRMVALDLVSVSISVGLQRAEVERFDFGFGAAGVEDVRDEQKE